MNRKVNEYLDKYTRQVTSPMLLRARCGMSGTWLGYLLLYVPTDYYAVSLCAGYVSRTELEHCYQAAYIKQQEAHWKALEVAAYPVHRALVPSCALATRCPVLV
eukprot:637320-Rhodomonas_salina.2